MGEVTCPVCKSTEEDYYEVATMGMCRGCAKEKMEHMQAVIDAFHRSATNPLCQPVITHVDPQVAAADEPRLPPSPQEWADAQAEIERLKSALGTYEIVGQQNRPHYRKLQELFADRNYPGGSLLVECAVVEIERLREERDECRRLLREALSWPVITTEEFANVIITESWRAAARAAGGGDE
jgi:hypothetical protein